MLLIDKLAKYMTILKIEYMFSCHYVYILALTLMDIFNNYKRAGRGVRSARFGLWWAQRRLGSAEIG